MVLIFDETGREQGVARRDVLGRLLTEKGVDSRALMSLSDQMGSANSFVLAHSSDLSDTAEKELRAGAAEGATVVLYSGGCLEEKKETLGSGYVLTMSWQTLGVILKRLPRCFAFSAFLTAFDTIRKSHLLHALVILSWCATFPSSDFRIAEAQKEWKSTPAKWLEIFAGCTRDDLLIACGGSPGGALPGDMSAVQTAIDWLWPSPGNPTAPPAFDMVLQQIQNRFLISV